MAHHLRAVVAGCLVAAVLTVPACGDDPLPPGPTNTTTTTPPTNQTAVSLQSLSITPSVVQPPAASSGQVTLSAATPNALTISLQSTNTAVAQVPGSVTVGAGASTATFAIQTSSVTAATNVSITATYSGVSRSATLTVTAPAPPNPNPTPNPNRTFWMGLSGNRVACTGGFLDIVLLENNVGQQGTLTLCSQDTLQPLAWMTAAPISIGPPNILNDREVVFDVYLANLTAVCKFHPNMTFFVNAFPYAFLFNAPPDLVPGEVWHGTRTLLIDDNARVTAQAPGDSYIFNCQ